MSWRLIITAVLIVTAIIISPYFFTPTESIVEINFSKDGNITQNNPGQKPDTWYLVYEEPGKPGLSVELMFDVVNKPNLLQGQRVHVEGVLRDLVVSVRTISQIE